MNHEFHRDLSDVSKNFNVMVFLSLENRRYFTLRRYLPTFPFYSRCFTFCLGSSENSHMLETLSSLTKAQSFVLEDGERPHKHVCITIPICTGRF